jgi:hypothetical protein
MTLSALRLHNVDDKMIIEYGAADGIIFREKAKHSQKTCCSAT